MAPYRLLAISGSLRADSLNSRLLRTLPALAPDGMTFDVFDGLRDVPLYDADLDGDPAHPAVQHLRDAIRAADGLVIATPEYNHSIPGVLKNAIDWASRPIADPPLRGKDIAVIVATGGRVLGLRSLVETTRILREIGNHVVSHPELVIYEASKVVMLDDTGAPAIADPRVAGLITLELEMLGRAIAAETGRMAAEAIAAARHAASARVGA